MLPNDALHLMTELAQDYINRQPQSVRAAIGMSVQLAVNILSGAITPKPPTEATPNEVKLEDREP